MSFQTHSLTHLIRGILVRLDFKSVVCLKLKDVSEEQVASIFGVKEYAK
jgi:hypothetical protein